MSNFAEALQSHYNPLSENDGWREKLEPLCPFLAQALEGEPGYERDKSKRPPLSLIVSVRDGRLRFTLSNPEWDRTYHCQVTDASEPLMSVERALAANQGEWVKKRTNGR